jgi:hypothetical protein
MARHCPLPSFGVICPCIDPYKRTHFERPAVTKSSSDHLKNDADRGKGSMEPDERTQSGNNSMKDQLGHRNPDPMQDGADSDFPEPGPSPEHSFEGEFKKIG